MNQYAGTRNWKQIRQGASAQASDRIDREIEFGGRMYVPRSARGRENISLERNRQPMFSVLWLTNIAT
jgi:hypothetical protein